MSQSEYMPGYDQGKASLFTRFATNLSAQLTALNTTTAPAGGPWFAQAGGWSGMPVELRAIQYVADPGGVRDEVIRGRGAELAVPLLPGEEVAEVR